MSLDCSNYSYGTILYKQFHSGSQIITFLGYPTLNIQTKIKFNDRIFVLKNIRSIQ